MREFKIPQGGSVKGKGRRNNSQVTLNAKPKKISEIEVSHTVRMSTGFSEFDRVLGAETNPPAGGGIVPGSIVLLSGDPGIGKSTLLLQTAINLAKARGPVEGFPPASAHSLRSTARVSGALPPSPPLANRKILYVTGEESEAQVTMRAKRLSKKPLSSIGLFILATSNIDTVLEHATRETYDLVIIDSIQTMESGNVPGYAGSIPQVRHATGRLTSLAKNSNTPVILIGHVTKEGMVAGPQTLSHMVDTVLYLEGEKMTGVRILRAFKNRFGDTSEVGIFGMEEYGLKEITDLSELFLGDTVQSPGSCVAVIMEGSRSILAEVQALTVSSNLPYPRRVASGILEKRLELLLAILQKHARLPVDKFDVFVNVVGGFKITEPSADLAVCLAIFSSLKARKLGKIAAIGEVGLLGEIKKVLNLSKRVKEAEKFKFKTVTFESAQTLSALLAKLYS